MAAAALNGMSLSAVCGPTVRRFFVFTDYMRPCDAFEQYHASTRVIRIDA
jgi:transketolase